MNTLCQKISDETFKPCQQLQLQNRPKTAISRHASCYNEASSAKAVTICGYEVAASCCNKAAMAQTATMKLQQQNCYKEACQLLQSNATCCNEAVTKKLL